MRNYISPPILIKMLFVKSTHFLGIFKEYFSILGLCFWRLISELGKEDDNPRDRLSDFIAEFAS